MLTLACCNFKQLQSVDCSTSVDGIIMFFATDTAW